MRISSTAVVAGRSALALMVVVGSVVLLSAPKPHFTQHDKAYYADQNLVNFVRPGLVIKIVSADIAADGTIKTRFRITDPKGLPLDKDGVTTPGAVGPRFIAAYIPKGQRQYTSYTTSVQTSPITSVSAVQASTDTGGTFEKVADGEYVYTFKTKASANFDKTVTHTIGVQASRDLSEFDMGTNYASNTFNFVPDGSVVKVTRDVVRNASCNRCHDDLAFHGGSRRGIEMCVLCHTPQTTDPDTGNTVDLPVMVHKIHQGKNLPSVKAGGKYTIIGHGQSESDWSTVAFPADPDGVRTCEICHEQGKGAAQEAAYLKPNRAACGACHDNVNFQTGENHVNLPQISDNQCSTCHIAQGELEFDASIKGAHTVDTRSATLPGVVVELVKVDKGTAGQKPTVTFTLKDKSGAPIPLTQMVGGQNRLALVMAGPTRDYGYTSFGSDVTTAGYVSEDATKGSCGPDGTCTYTFQHAVPADAKGTFSIGVEARRGATLMAGTKQELSTEYGAINKVINFSVDGTPVQARRQVVSINKCNQCHGFLSMHGENRNQIEQCVLCHNPSETDQGRRVTAKDPALKSAPPQAVDFALMIHKIHTGEAMKEYGRDFTIVGYGGTSTDFTEVRYPAMGPTGHVGERRNCSMCHVNGSEQLPLQDGLNKVTDPQGLLNPVGMATAACTGCHQSMADASHALANTTELGESCAACHGTSSDFSVNRVHAR